MTVPSQHASPERASWEHLHEQLTIVSDNAALQGSIYQANECILLLNEHRQIVYANAACQKMLCGNDDPATLYGRRPGEALRCVHADAGEGGCGTSQDCRVCGAVNAVLQSLSGAFDVQRCSIECEKRSDPIECITFAMPVRLGSEIYSLVSIMDASAEEAVTQLAKHAFAMRGKAACIEEG